VKVYAVFMLFFACLVPCQADTTQTWDIGAACPSPCPVPFTLSATMTTELESPVYEIFSGDTVLIPQPVETGISGRFNGLPVSTPNLTPGPNGITYWLLAGNTVVPEVPMGIEFEAGGDVYEILYDEGIQIFDLTVGFSAPISGEQIGWGAVDVTHVPEPAAVWSLLTGMFLLALSRWAVEQQSIPTRSEVA
jgi:hypothetical protein